MIVLLFMVVALILITSVLAVTGNNIQIAGLHRDGVRALELAHAGLTEGWQRLEFGPHVIGIAACPGSTTFTPSIVSVLASRESLATRICLRASTGDVTTYEVQADSTVERAVRRLSLIVIVIQRNIVPDIILAKTFGTQGAGKIPDGDIYAAGAVRLKNNASTWPDEPGPPPQRVFAGWYVRPVQPDRDACYARPCTGLGWGVDADEVYPGTRRSVHQASIQGLDILQNTCATYDGCPNQPTAPGADSWAVVSSDLAGAINAAQTTLNVPVADSEKFAFSGVVQIDSERIAFSGRTGAVLTGLTRGAGGTTAASHTAGTTVYLGGPTCAVAATGGSPLTASGVRAEDPSQPADPAGADPAAKPIVSYGFDLDATAGSVLNAGIGSCGFPYRYFSETIDAKTRYFKMIVYEHWKQTYFDTSTYSDTPQFAAIPPFPAGSFFTDALTPRTTVTAPPSTLNNGSNIDIGCPSPVPAGTTCTAGSTPGVPRIVFLTGPAGTTWRFEGSLAGYGTLVIEGDLDIRGTIDYKGTIFVRDPDGNPANGGGTVFGTGTAKVTGGLVTQNPSSITGTLTITAGANPNPAAERQLVVIPGAMWER